MADDTTNENSFPSWRAATIAAGIVGFLVIFRPFGLKIDNALALFVVLGLAPLNFLGMMLAHSPTLPRGVFGSGLRVGGIAAANILYLSLVTSDGATAALSVKVILVAMLTVAAVMVWNERRTLKREVFELRTQERATSIQTVVLKGENESEILRIAPDALRFVAANGNYVDIHYLKNGEPEKVMLRGTLASILEQAPDGVFIQSHRSYLVNLAAAQRIVASGGSMEIEFADGERVPVSRGRRDEIKAAALA